MNKKNWELITLGAIFGAAAGWGIALCLIGVWLGGLLVLGATALGVLLCDWSDLWQK